MSLDTFGDHTRRTTENPNICKQFPINSGTIQEINACVTPHITSPIRKIAIDTVKHASLHDLPLAEPLTYPHKHLHIDILIGLDHYYDIIVSDRLTSLIVQLLTKFLMGDNNLQGYGHVQYTVKWKIST